MDERPGAGIELREPVVGPKIVYRAQAVTMQVPLLSKTQQGAEDEVDFLQDRLLRGRDVNEVLYDPETKAYYWRAVRYVAVAETML